METSRDLQPMPYFKNPSTLTPVILCLLSPPDKRGLPYQRQFHGLYLHCYSPDSGCHHLYSAFLLLEMT